MKSVRFVNFWPKFNPYNNEFLPIIYEANGYKDFSILQDRDIYVDLEVGSNFGPRLPFLQYIPKIREDLIKNERPFKVPIPKNSKNSLLVTWENDQSERNDWNYHLGYKRYLDKNKSAYLPIWFTKTDLFNNKLAEELNQKTYSINKLLIRRKIINKNSNQKICTFINRSENFRIYILNQLNSRYSVDKFGNLYRNWVADKIATMSEYSFNFTPENSLYPGYVTEKILDSYAGKSIPIWWGLDVDEYLNEKMFINLIEYQDIQDLFNEIDHLICDHDAHQNKLEEPFLKKAPDKERIIYIMSKALGIES